MPEAQTLFDKIWSTHAIQTRQDGATLLHIDRHLVHDGSSNAFRMLGQRNLPVRRPDRTFATPDHMWRRQVAACLRSTSRTAAPWSRTSRLMRAKPV